ncbi:hypothetical protein VPH35_092426 [Triticum aestivum]
MGCSPRGPRRRSARQSFFIVAPEFPLPSPQHFRRRFFLTSKPSTVFLFSPPHHTFPFAVFLRILIQLLPAAPPPASSGDLSYPRLLKSSPVAGEMRELLAAA